MATTVDASQLPLVVIVGPTASGKTKLAIELAQQWGGEVISADSRAIYKGMDIGAAKPSVAERADVPHWGIDLVNPGERFTAADFKSYATQKIAEIRERGHIPILVGGTGLYVDAILFDYEFGADGDPKQRLMLEDMTLEQLREYCIKNNILLPKDSQNERRLIRAIERSGADSKRSISPISTSIIVGIATEKTQLRAKISLRAEQILTNGVVDEATILSRKYGWDNEAMTGNVYPLVRQYLVDEISNEELVDKLATLDWKLSKRQMTWLRRNPFIYWGDASELRDYVSAALTTEV